jgi:hypothetical protein
MNLKPGCSFINTTPAGTEAVTGATILQMPEGERCNGHYLLIQ